MLRNSFKFSKQILAYFQVIDMRNFKSELGQV